MTPRRLLAHVAVLCAVGSAGRAHAQLPADVAWQSMDSRHFRVTYHAGLEQLARHAAVSAERAHAALAVMVAEAPRGRIDIVVSDNVDFSNGYATPFPSPRIVVYARPPVDMLELQYMHDWIDLVVTHELAHIFHLEVTGAFGRLLRGIFGRAPSPWPLFPAVGTPLWSIEGLAVGVESALGGFGRVHGSYHEMVVRTAALDGRIDDIDRLQSTSPVWPGPMRVYIYGSLFMDYLTRRFGPDATARIVRSTAGALIPPPLWFGDVGRRALGVSFRQAYDDWREEQTVRFAALAAELSARGLTTGEPMTMHDGFALFPRFAPDGRSIAYAASDGRTAPATRVLDTATGEELWSRRRNDLSALGWLPDGTLLSSDVEFIDRFRIHGDLRIVGPRGERRLTHGARLQDPDADAGAGRIVAVQNGWGTNRLVLLDGAAGQLRPVTDFDPDVHWSLPRFSPAGDRIAVGRWRTGGVYDIVLLDLTGRVVLEVSGGSGISAAPAWSPDGRWLLFWSDRTGIANLYASEVGSVAGPAASPPGAAPMPLRQVTNVLTGAYYPDVSPDGRWIAYAAYHGDGFRIERLPFDPQQWREPDRAGTGELAEARGVYADAAAAVAFEDSIRAAVAAADTTVGAPRPYRALAHVRPYGWLPTASAERDGGTFLGALLYGSDLVERHDWVAALAVEPGSGRTEGQLAYTFRGLPTVRHIGVHPSVTLGLVRDWDVLFRDDNDRRIEEREDRAAVTLGLTRPRFRTRLSGSVSGELIRRSAYLYGAGWAQGAALRDPVDDLLGIRAAATLTTFINPRFAISRENGVVLQLAGRQRWDRSVSDVVIDDDIVVFDAGYRELTTWNAAYRALPLPGFARHVVAVRMSGLLRDGPGAGTSGIGGVSGAGLAVLGLPWESTGTGRLLPVRGYAAGARRGTRAWTASAEYRAPLLLLTRALRPFPIFLDRLAGSAFVDAGHAWCDPDALARLPAGACPSVSAGDAPLVAAGAELLGMFSLWGAPVPVRAGFGVPLRTAAGRGARFHVTTGAFF
jgi:hypothetical protein